MLSAFKLAAVSTFGKLSLTFEAEEVELLQLNINKKHINRSEFLMKPRICNEIIDISFEIKKNGSPF